MTDFNVLLEQLRATESQQERLTLLRRYAPLPIAFFTLIKDEVSSLLGQDINQALDISEIGLTAVPFAQGEEGVALSWWARGNALIFSDDYDECLGAYTTAVDLYTQLGKKEAVAQLQSNCMGPLMYMGRYAEAQAMGQSAMRALSPQGKTPALANLQLNLGVCALRQGNHENAEDLTASAANIFADLGYEMQAARCRVTQALALRHLDRFIEAQASLEETLTIFEDYEAQVPWARAAANLGILHASLARYQDALSWLEQSRQKFLDAGITMDAAVVDLYRAQTFLDLNLLSEARKVSQSLVEAFTDLQMPRQVGRAMSILAEIHLREQDKAQALHTWQQARRIFDREGDTFEVALLDLSCAACLRRLGRSHEGLRLASEAIKSLDVSLYPLHHAEAHFIMAQCCEDLGRVEEAQLAYQVAWTAGSYPTGTTEPPASLASRISYARGVIASAAGNVALARGEYERAVTFLNRVAQSMSLSEFRGSYLTDKRSVYEAAIMLALDEERPSEALRYSELARAGTLRDLLAGASHTQDIEDPTSSLEARREQRLYALRQPVELLAEAHGEIHTPTDRPATIREATKIEKSLVNAYRQRQLQDPRFAILTRGEVPDLPTTQRHLTPERAILAFDVLDQHLYVFIITTERLDVCKLSPLDKLRREAASLAHTLEEVRLFTRPADQRYLQADLLGDLQTFYDMVLARPLERLDPSIRHLLVVPSDVLSTLPLAAFHDGEHYVLERYTLCYIPGTSLLPVLPSARYADKGIGIVLGHSWQERLPLATDEAQQVAKILTRQRAMDIQLRIDAAATSQHLRDHIGETSLLHIAAHATFRETAPLFSALYLADIPLNVYDLYQLDLSHTALVTLSGCQTGLGESRGGELLGLTHACFSAGAPTLVVSGWRIDDEATSLLMQHFYAALADGQPVASALRTAQLSTQVLHPHAYYWAGFTVWGRGFEPIFPARR